MARFHSGVLYPKSTTISGNYVPYSSRKNFPKKSDLRRPKAVGVMQTEAHTHTHTEKRENMKLD